MEFGVEFAEYIVEDVDALHDISCVMRVCDQACHSPEATVAASLSLTTEILPTNTSNIDLSLLRCDKCQKYQAIWYRNRWSSFDDFLSVSDSDSTEITPVKSIRSRVCLWVLSQVLYGEFEVSHEEGECEFLPPSGDEFARLVLLNGSAVGFYTLKRKGAAYKGNPPVHFQMNMLDTIYVRKSYRKLGLGKLLIADALLVAPEEDLGFSQPISLSMLHVLKTILKESPRLRDRLWLCDYIAIEGYKQNAWYAIKELL